MYLVDAKDVERLPESKEALDELLAFEDIARIPFLILGNKIDHPDAISEDELRQRLGLYQTSKSFLYYYSSKKACVLMLIVYCSRQRNGSRRCQTY